MRKSFYAAIDLKSFYASVECVNRGLDPMTTNLVVADQSRTDGTICLAVSPSLKKLGLSGRARLFQVKERAKLFKAETGRDLEYIVAPPRMKKYLDYSNRLYRDVFLNFVAGDDIFRYSIDEVFLDITSYLKFSKKSPEDFTRAIVRKIFETTGLIATAGVGTNLYLAKIAMDILAKHAEPDATGARLASLDERSFKEKLWGHEPLTDFWSIGHQTAKKLGQYNLRTFGDLARVALKDEDFFYKLFGIDAEIFIDHLWGIEPVTMQDVKRYRPKVNSLSNGQVLGAAVNAKTARLLLAEMVDELSLDLVQKSLKTNLITLDLFYSKDTSTAPSHGSIHPEDSAGSPIYTASPKILRKRTLELFDKIIKSDKNVKRLYISFGNVLSKTVADSRPVQLDLFTPTVPENTEARDEDLSHAILKIRNRFGKNAILNATSLEDGANLCTRNHQIGGHHE
ncbi:DNA methylase [Candidatus Saccharibacteria bacterium]|nr:DNA methylase [Candidatus Saccharibacteria bacterium]